MIRTSSPRHATVLYATSQASLFGNTLYSGEDVAFAFARAASRLREMQSERYRVLHTQRRVAEIG